MLALIREINSGQMSGANLSAADRRRCVEHLTAEGYSVAEIAEIFKVAERTINRDRDAIKQANSLKFRPELVGEMAGQVVRTAELAMAQLRRLARERDAPAAVRAEASRSMFTICREMVQTLQQLGYLPTAPARVLAHVTGQMAMNGDVNDDGSGSNGVPNLAQIQDESRRLRACLGSAPDAAKPLLDDLERVESECQRLGLAARVQSVAAKAAEIARRAEVGDEGGNGS